jgi:hypothetical protein
MGVFDLGLWGMGVFSLGSLGLGVLSLGVISFQNDFLNFFKIFNSRLEGLGDVVGPDEVGFIGDNVSNADVILKKK